MHPLALAALTIQLPLVKPFRRLRVARMAAAGSAPISVPFYHRVADSHARPWSLGCDQFQRHIDYYQQYFELIDLAEVQRRVDSRASCAPAVSITFDDGYRDNSDFALPMLIERKIPCTYFVNTGHVQHQKPFQHDQRIHSPLPVHSVKEIRELSDAGIEIGCHTCNHVDFSQTHDAATIRSEIVTDKDQLEQLIGKRVRYFAFPFGMPPQLTKSAIAAVVEAGFDGFCSAFGAYNLVGRDSFHIRRFHADREFPRLENWLSFAPRKVRLEPHVPLPGHQPQVASLPSGQF